MHLRLHFAEQSDICRRQTAAAFREWNVVIEVKIETRSSPKLTNVLPPISSFRFAHPCRSRPRGSIVSRLAPAALDRYLAAAPAMSRFPTAPFTRRYPRDFTFYVADPVSSIVQITFCAAAFADYGEPRNKRKF